MEMHQKIMNMLDGSSSQKPCSFDDLQKKCGLEKETLAMVLDTLYQNKAINQAFIIKGQQRERVIWPTGVINKIDLRKFRITPVKPKDKEKVVEKNKYTDGANSLRILRFIEDHPDCYLNEIAKATQIKTPEPFIKTRINSGMVIVDVSTGRKKFKLKPDCDAETAYARQSKNKASQSESNEKTNKVPETKDAHGQLADAISSDDDVNGFAVPAFIKEGQPTEQSDLEFQLETKKTKFRVALTDDMCLMLFGLQDSPIELNPQQSSRLISFLVDHVR